MALLSVAFIPVAFVPVAFIPVAYIPVACIPVAFVGAVAFLLMAPVEFMSMAVAPVAFMSVAVLYGLMALSPAPGTDGPPRPRDAAPTWQGVHVLNLLDEVSMLGLSAAPPV